MYKQTYIEISYDPERSFNPHFAIVRYLDKKVENNNIVYERSGYDVPVPIERLVLKTGDGPEHLHSAPTFLTECNGLKFLVDEHSNGYMYIVDKL